jgi:hypothetical protein
LQLDWNTYGAESFVFATLEEINLPAAELKTVLWRRECEWLKKTGWGNANNAAMPVLSGLGSTRYEFIPPADVEPAADQALQDYASGKATGTMLDRRLNNPRDILDTLAVVKRLGIDGADEVVKVVLSKRVRKVRSANRLLIFASGGARKG